MVVSWFQLAPSPRFSDSYRYSLVPLDRKTAKALEFHPVSTGKGIRHVINKRSTNSLTDEMTFKLNIWAINHFNPFFFKDPQKKFRP
jgi:hypothetical protein